uniref:APC1_C domain-containing protein n=1 Tax=Anopheles maculatus TaxID=74869 RepID=A0A182S8Z1_9DIPT
SIFKTNERVDVKQRTGCLTYQEDPTRLITNQINPGSYNHCLWQLEPLNLLRLVGQPEVINITRMLLIPPGTRKMRCLLEPIGSAEHENPYMNLYAHHVTDCVFGDRLHALPIYLGLTQILQDDPRAMHKSLDAWQLRLLTVVLDKCDWPYKIPGERGFLSISLLQSLLKRIWKRCDEQFARYKPIVHQYLNLRTISDPNEGLVGESSRDCPMETENESNPERRREHLLNLVKLIVLYDLPYGTLPSEAGTWRIIQYNY